MILYIYGPQGCGKTSNAKRFQRHYMMPVYEEAKFFDDTTKQLSRVIILGGEKPIEDETKQILSITNISFEQAMKESAE